MDVVGARAMGLNGLFRSVSGDTDEPARSEKRSSGPNVQRIETEVDALGPHCECDVNPAVDDDFDFRRIRPSHPADLCGKFKPVAAVERAVAKLDSVDTPPHVGLKERVKPTLESGLVDNPTKAGLSGAQNRAIPSIGLEADAYSRMGIRPDV